MEIKNVVAAAIVDKNKILVAQRNDGKYAGYWEFPGGKIKDGENEKDALKREILEELNLEIRVNDRFCTVEYDYPDFHLSMKCYYAQIISGEIKLSVHSNLKWVNKDELKRIGFLPADIIVASNINF